MAASSYFHRNVLLLTEVVATSDDFKTHFHEGMFDKPNTVGFIHVSQFLLTIYDAERFKKLIQWPIICKKTEVKYCRDVKDYLNVIANENPDVDFPRIAGSYLAGAHGRKFNVFMWKLSIVVLRTYLKRNCNQDVLYAPRLGPMDELIKTHLQKRNKDTISSITSQRRNIQEIKEKSTIIMAEEEEHLAKIKREIFESKQSIQHLISEAPVNLSAKECLAKVENMEIIPLWKQIVTENIAHIKKKHVTLQNVETLSNRLTNMICSRVSNTEILNAEQLTKVNSSAILLLPSSTNVQYLLHHLYVDNKLMLFNFIQLFNLLLCQIYQCLRNNDLKDLSECLLQIEASQEDMKTGIKSFQNLITNIASASSNIKLNCQRKMNQTYQENISPMKNISLIPSPNIRINTNCCIEGNDVPKRLELTPVEGAHKYLFSRYKRQHGNNNIPVSQLRTNLLVSRINFDDSISLNVSDKIVIPHISKTNSLPAKYSGKYSHLFASSARKVAEKGNYSMMSIPHYSKANSTTITNTAGDLHNVSQFSLDNTMKSLFDSSKEIPEKLDTISNLKFPRTFKEIDTHDYLYKRDNQIKENNTGDTTDNKLKSVENKTKRRSIGDLVQRYKRALELSNQTPTYPEN